MLQTPQIDLKGQDNTVNHSSAKTIMEKKQLKKEGKKKEEKISHIISCILNDPVIVFVRALTIVDFTNSCDRPHTLPPVTVIPSTGMLPPITIVVPSAGMLPPPTSAFILRIFTGNSLFDSGSAWSFTIAADARRARRSEKCKKRALLFITRRMFSRKRRCRRRLL